MKAIWTGIVLSLFLNSAYGEVIQFKARRSSCEKIMRSTPAEIIEFPQPSPSFLVQQSFFQQQSEEPLQLIFYTGRHPNPFLEQESGEWSLVPFLPNGPDLIVIRATYRKFGPPLKSSRMSFRELRTHYVLHAFTRVRVLPLYRTLHDIIESVRGLESQFMENFFNPPQLDLKQLISPAPLSRRLDNYVNSWSVHGPHERRIQELIKEWIWRRQPDRGDREESLELFEVIQTEMRRIYGGDPLVDLLLANLEGYSQ